MKQMRAKDGTVHNFPDHFPDEAVRLAMLAYDNADEWGGLAKYVANVVREKMAEGAGELVRRKKEYPHAEDADRDVVGKIKASMLTGLGLDAAIASYVGGVLKGSHPRFQFGDNSLQMLNSPIGDRAYTLGNVQIYPRGRGPDTIHRSYTGAVMRRGDHEAGHTAQAQRMGGLPMGLAWLVGGRGVASNPLEIDADEFGVRRQRERGR